jgi:hypothetical protein
MQKKQIYKQDIIDTLKVEIGKFKDHKKQELTLDKILVHAKKDIAELIELNCTAQEIAAIFSKSGVKVGINRIKKIYFTSTNRNKLKPSSRINQIVKEQI